MSEVDSYYQILISKIDAGIQAVLQKTIEWRKNELAMLNELVNRASSRALESISSVDFEVKRLWRPRIVPTRFGISLPELEKPRLKLKYPGKDFIGTSKESEWYDTVMVVDEEGRIVTDEQGNPLTYRLPRIPFYEIEPTESLELLRTIQTMVQGVEGLVIETTKELSSENILGASLTEISPGENYRRYLIKPSTWYYMALSGYVTSFPVISGVNANYVDFTTQVGSSTSHYQQFRGRVIADTSFFLADEQGNLVGEGIIEVWIGEAVLERVESPTGSVTDMSVPVPALLIHGGFAWSKDYNAVMLYTKWGSLTLFDLETSNQWDETCVGGGLVILRPSEWDKSVMVKPTVVTQ